MSQASVPVERSFVPAAALRTLRASLRRIGACRAAAFAAPKDAPPVEPGLDALDDVAGIRARRR